MDEHKRQSKIEDSELLRPKGLLYHYTTLDGFLGILDSDNLRATHIRYMNDSKEFVDALEYLSAFIDEFKVDIRTNLRQFLDWVMPTFNGWGGAYIVSFSDDDAQAAPVNACSGDRLSQWKAYSSAGRGISLGFDALAIDKSGCGQAWILNEGVAFLRQCSYNFEDKEAEFRRTGKGMAQVSEKELDEFASAITWKFELNVMELMSKGASLDALGPTAVSTWKHRTALIAAFVVNATLFKNKAFFEEKEWRIVMLPSIFPEDRKRDGSKLPVRFRCGTMGITPYTEFPLGLRTPESPLRKIVVGPTPHMEQALNAIKMLLEDRGVRLKSKDFTDGVEVVPSQIPYRNW